MHHVPIKSSHTCLAKRRHRSSMTEKDLNIEKVANWWDQSREEGQKKSLVAWMEHAQIKRHINRRTTGDESLSWFKYVLQKYFKSPIDRALSLGCGTGGLERNALWAEAVGFFDAYDVSPGAVESAKKAAIEAGILERINYKVGDLNHIQLKRHAYDAVFSSMSIHHIQALENVFESVRASLRPSGLFIINEYIGPNRFQLPPVQIGLINDMLEILPQRLRKIIRGGQITSDIKHSYEVLPLTWFDENDPSEAVRSGDIMAILERFFTVLEFKPYGGALLQFIVEDIVGNFDDNDQEDRAWLEMLEFVENKLEEVGVIKSDFALIVSEPKT